MKKFLFWVFSIVLTASAAAPASAQALAKKGETKAPVATSVAKKATTPTKSVLGQAQKRTSQYQAVQGQIQAARPYVFAKSETPAYEGAALPNLKGCVVYQDTWSEGNQPVGLYTLPASASADFDLMFTGPNATYGGVAVDGVYYATDFFSFWGMVFVTVEGYDLESGEVVGTWNPEDVAVVGIDYTYDPVSGKVYGITYNSEGSGMQLSELSFGDEVTSTAIAALDGAWNAIAADKDGVLYGIKRTLVQAGESNVCTESQLVKFNKEDGTYETIGVTGQLPQYLTSATIDPVSNRMFWTVCSPAEDGFLCEVNLQTGAATKLFDLPGSAEVTGLFVAAPAAEPKAPAAVTDLTASFPEGKLIGSLTFKVPSTLFDGTPATGNVKYKVTANGDLVDLASVAYGETVTIEPVTVYETGNIEFVVVLTNEVGDSPKAKVKCFVGNGVPNAPANVTAEYSNGQMNVTWDPVTKSADGGYVNPAEVKYTVTAYPGATVVKNLTSTSFTQTFAAPEKFTQYYYEVTATFADATSVVAVSNKVNLGAIDPAYEVEFTSADVLSPFTIIDANGDNRTWTYTNGAIRVQYNMTLDMDDWIITAPIRMKAGFAYNISADLYAHNATSPEKFEIMAGTAPTVEAMTTTIVPATETTSLTAQTYSNYFVAPADGLYYVGIHGISRSNMWYLYMSKFAVAAGVPSTVPDAGTINPVADPSGAYKVNIAVVTPGLNLAGEEVGALTKAELYRGETLIKTWNSPAASSALSFTDELEAFGPQTYTFVAYTASGKGKAVSASCFVGTDKPAAPKNVYLQETEIPGYLTVSWDAVDTDANGNPINPDNVTYAIHAITDDGYIGDAIASDLHITAYTFEAFDPEGEQEFAQYALVATTEGGTTAVATDMVPVGKAYEGMDESFPNGTLNYIFGMSTAGGATWAIGTDATFSDLSSYDGDGGFIYWRAQYLAQYASLFTGKISLAGFENPVFTFYTVPISAENTNTILVEARDVTGAFEPVLDIACNEIGTDMNWTKVIVPLNKFAGKNIQLRITVTCNAMAVCAFDQLFVGNQLNNDLVAANITAPAKLNPGAEFDVDVKVNNEGAKEAKNFKVELYENGELASTKTVESLASGKNVTLSFEQTMSKVATEAVKYNAIVVYDADEAPENNETELIAVVPNVSKLPAVQNLNGEAAAKGNILRWEEPKLEGVAMGETETFEDATGFEQNMEGWTFVDADESPVGGFQGSDIPGITPGQTLASFFVFDNDIFGGNQTFDAHSGSKYLASLFRYDDGQVDDWAISPELSGAAQTISFWAKSYSSQYPETIGVYYSLTGTAIEDFVAVEDAEWEGLSDEWTEYTAELPEGAKYFAIRSMASGSFMLMVDDVTFATADDAIELSILGYDVYRDGQKLNDALLEECSYLDVTGEHGKLYTYAVVPTFNKGEGRPATLDLQTGINDVETGIVITTADKNIVVTGAEGLEVVVNTVDGKVLFSGVGEAKTVVPAATGVYVVKAGEKVAKVVVK